MKRFCIITSILILLLSSITNIVYATENNKTIVADENILTNSVNDENSEDGIMPISIEGEAVDTEISNSENEYLETLNSLSKDYSDIYKIEQNINIDKEVLGDIYLISEKAEISSNNVDGNIFIMAGEVNISGDVSGFAYIMADKVNITGRIKGAYIMANEINIEENGYILNNLKVMANTININGTVGRNLYAISDKINIEVDENSKPVKVLGGVFYSGQLNASDGAILGQTVKYDMEIEEPDKEDIIKTDIIESIQRAITALIIICIIILLQNNNKTENIDVKTTDYIKNIAIGLGIVILIPILAALLMFSAICMPIGMILIILYLIALYISIPVASINISKAFLKQDTSKVKKILCALVIFVVFEVIRYVPIIGGIIRFFAVLLGFDIIVMSIFKKDKNKIQEDKSKLEENTENIIEEKTENTNNSEEKNKEVVKENIVQEDKKTDTENDKEENSENQDKN